MKNFCFFLLLLTGFQLQAQNRIGLKKCCQVAAKSMKGRNALTSVAITEYDSKPEKSFLKYYYNIDPADSLAEVTGLVRFFTPMSAHNHQHFLSLSKAGGNVYTFRAYLKKLKEIDADPLVAYVSLGRKAEPLAGKRALTDANIDSVHNGIYLPMPYTGKGVICGAVDVAIDYSHPALRSESGDSLRVLKAWAQNLKKGSKPEEYDYGVEFDTPAEILQAHSDSIPGHHGSISVGSMVSSGFGSGGKYRGPAPEAGIILVSSNYSESSLLDAINYFFSNIRKYNKRGVFNLSWGSHVGPHDGTSLFDQAIDSLVSNGAILVGAAGNWGTSPMHIKNTSGNEPVTTSSVLIDSDTSSYTLVDIWGKPDSRFSVQLKAFDKTTGELFKSTTTISTSQATGTYTFKLPFGKDTSIIYFAVTSSDAFNQRPNCLIVLYHNHIKTNKNMAVSITSTNNEVHAWAASNANFSSSTQNLVQIPGHTQGNSQYTVSELGGTSKSIITVGAHVSSPSFLSETGEIRTFSADSGQIEPFSSYGPTLDGRQKPDLTAPGTVFAPVNSTYFDLNTTPERVAVIKGSGFNFEGKEYYWMGEQATSFAAPVVTGSIALMLEANPHLDFQQIKSILLNNTTRDSFTGKTDSLSENHWGKGKLNVFRALSSLPLITDNPSSSSKPSKFWYSNPFGSTLVVYTTENLDSNPILEIYDLLGKKVDGNGLELVRKEGDFLFYNSGPLEQGQYIGVLKTGKDSSLKMKLIKNF